MITPNTKFESEACFTCPVEESCAAGQLFVKVENETRNVAEDIFSSHSDAFVDAIEIGDSIPESRFVQFRKDIESARDRAGVTRSGLESVLVTMIRRRDDWKRRPAQNHLRDRFDDLADIVAELPHPTNILEQDSVLQELHIAGEDALRFAKQGICGAIEVGED